MLPYCLRAHLQRKRTILSEWFWRLCFTLVAFRAARHQGIVHVNGLPLAHRREGKQAMRMTVRRVGLLTAIVFAAGLVALDVIYIVAASSTEQEVHASPVGPTQWPIQGQSEQAVRPPMHPRAGPELALGAPAPDFCLPEASGSYEHSLSSFRKRKPVVLVFASFS